MMGPEVVVKPEVRCRGVVAGFAEDVAGKVAAGFEFKMNRDCVDVVGVLMFRKIFRKWSWPVSVGSDVECVVNVRGSVVIYFVEFYHDESPIRLCRVIISYKILKRRCAACRAEAAQCECLERVDVDLSFEVVRKFGEVCVESVDVSFERHEGFVVVEFVEARMADEVVEMFGRDV